MKSNGKEKELEGKALLTFLKRTKEGKYATITKGSLALLRERLSESLRIAMKNIIMGLGDCEPVFLLSIDYHFDKITSVRI